MGLAGAEIGHLAPGVHPGVGTARADEGGLLPGEALEGFFQDLLNRQGLRLALPAVVAGAVVFQEEADVARRSMRDGYLEENSENNQGSKGEQAKMIRVKYLPKIQSRSADFSNPPESI